MSPAYFDDILEFFRLVFESLVKCPQIGNQRTIDLACDGDMHSGGESVVRALRSVDIIVGMDRLFGTYDTSQDLDCSVADDL